MLRMRPTVAIPPGAVALSYFTLGLPVTVQWVDHAGAIVASYTQGALDAPSTVPIPGDAQAIILAGLAIGRAVFGVAA